MNTIKIAGKRGKKIDTAAYVSKSYPGLAVHRSIAHNDCWTITHIASGRGITSGYTHDTKREAVELATFAATLADWTADMKTVIAAMAKDANYAKFRQKSNDLRYGEPTV